MHNESKINILMVDDEPANLLSLEEVLKDLGQNLVRAASGEEALRLVLKDDYAVILLDVRMAGMDGFETATLIRSRAKSRQTPIIFLTGLDQDIAQTFRGYEVGAVDYMVKPIVPEILKSKVAVFVELYHKTLEIRVQEQKYRKIFESFPDIYFRTDMAGTLMLVSPSIFVELGYEPDEVMGRSIAQLFVDTAVAEALIQALSGSDSIKDFEVCLLARDGRKVDFSVNAHTVHGHKNDAVALEGALRNITERKEVERLRVEESMREQSRILQSILDSMGDGVVVADTSGSFLLFNPAAETITGVTSMSLADWENQFSAYLPDMLTPYPKSQIPLTRAIRGEVVDGAEVYLLSDKIPHGKWLSINARPLKDGDGKLYGGVAVFRDVTDNKQSEQRLAYLAQYDPLTGLPNRNLFRDRFIQAMARASRGEQLVALMFLDLDHFKGINDSLGHEAGDLLLKAVAERLNACVRQSDTVARLGGDEFTVILEGRVNVEHVTVVAQKIIEGMMPSFKLGDSEVFITTSIGIVIYCGEDGYDTDTLIKNADTAMYHAKEHGRNNFQMFTPQMHDKSFGRLTAENNLRRAMERDELTVHYQPQIDMSTGRITGAEALLRWQPADSVLLLPSHFIEMAEETGLIGPIGEWVLETACRQNKAWQDEGLPPLRVAVNFSARQLTQDNLVDVIKRILDETGLDPYYLDMEITEDHLMKNIQASSLIIGELKAMGINISLDDFGTGYSSLSYLKHFPLDTLKIDESFVRNIATDPQDAAIATTIIELAHGLNFKVIAEGVETLEQQEFLRAKGCDGMQGYLFSHPVTAEEFAKLLEMEQQCTGSSKKKKQKSYPN
ncbi:MAG: EAL domain-containing protein [Gammaproteobacteria bacterium]